MISGFFMQQNIQITLNALSKSILTPHSMDGFKKSKPLKSEQMDKLKE